MASCHPSYSSLSSSPSSIPKRSHFPSFASRRPSGGSKSATGTGSTNLPVPKSNISSTSGVAVAASPNTLDHHHTNGTDTNYTHASNSNTQQSGTSAGSGIPSFRSLRSFLPFTNAFKQQQPHSQTAHEHNTPSKSSFAGFGSMRKSMNLTREKEKETRRERKMSLASDLPFITIERKPLERADDVDGPLRRSMSLPGMEAPGHFDPEKPLPTISSGNFIGNTDGEDELKAYMFLRTPSPGPPLLAELSTIIEADSSGISKHIPLHSPSTDSSSSLPTSPHRVAEEDTIRRPGSLHPPVTPAMTSSPLDPSTPANSNISLSLLPPNLAITEEADPDLGLELSTSQLASQVQDAMAQTSWSGSDAPVMVDVSFAQQDYQGHFDDEREDIDFSLLAQAGSASPSPSPSTPSFPAGPPGDDDTSHINNSLSSVVNPNELCSSSVIRGEQNMTLDLGSLDSDLRDAVTRRSHQSPISPAHSGASGHTVTPSSPPLLHPSPITQRQSSISGFRSTSAGSGPSSSTIYDPLSSSIPQPKRRVASSFLPRLRSPPPPTAMHSAPASAKNSPSPQKMSFERAQNTETASSPRSPVFVMPQANRSMALANARVGKVGGGLTTSTPAKVKPTKSVAQGGHSRISSLPVVSRTSPKDTVENVETEEAVGPEVKIDGASGELDHRDTLEWRDDVDKSGMGRWSLQNGLYREGNPIIKAEPDDDSNARILGSPFRTSADCVRLGHGPSCSPSYSPCPSPTLLPPPTLRRTTTPKLNDRLSINDGSSSTPTDFITASSSSPYPPSQSLVSTPLLSQSDSTGNASSREASPSKLAGAGSLGGRISRRTQAPPGLFWDNGENNGSPREETRELVILPERQPSPLRSVFRADKYGGDEVRSGRPSIDDASTVRSVRPSLDSARPSLDSARPSLDSYPGSSSASRRSPQPRYYGSNEPSTSRPPTRLRDREGLIARIRKRSVGAQDYSGEEDPPRDLLSPAPHVGNLSSATISARERLARARYRELGGTSRPWSSMSLRSGRPEALLGGGGRKRAGESSSVIYVGERNRSPGGIERSTSERAGERERREKERDITMYRDRSGSVSALGGVSSGGIGTLGRYASLRSTSEYNFGAVGSSMVDLSSQRQHTTRAYSRTAFSESSGGSGHGRRDSVTYPTVGHGLMESPISTVSTNVSGSARDTARSTSTGATSVSQSPLGNMRERDELRELKEKHAVETGALLGALSDSQRTCRVLREENGELRERMMELERENERLKVMLGESEQEVERLKVLREQDRERGWLRERESGDRRGGLSMSIGNGTIASWRSSATQRDFTLGSRVFIRQKELNDFSTGGESQLAKRHSRSKLDNVLFSREAERDFSPEPESSSPEMDFENQDQFSNRLLDESFIVDDAQEDAPDDVPVLSPTISSTPSQSTVHKRRPSTSSSIFPVPPPNMTMLLDDESAMFQLSNSRRNSAEINSLHSFKPLSSGGNGSSVLPIHPSRREELHKTNSSLSNVSISPENLSMITSGTGSPGSLFLKPEHEMMLDEMESLDLNRYREEADGYSDAWN